MLSMCEYAAIRVGFKSFWLTMRDCADIRVGFKTCSVKYV